MFRRPLVPYDFEISLLASDRYRFGLLGVSHLVEDPADPDAAARLAAEFRTWVQEAWPFQQVAFPGRSSAWDDWLALPDR